MVDYEVLTKFRVGDLVRIKYDLGYFDDSVHGIAMTVISIEHVVVDGEKVVMYVTNKLDPVFQTPYNEDELVGSNFPLPPRD